MPIIKIKQYNKGQTLIEVVLAVGVAVVVITALVILATSALRTAQEALRKSESSKFANAGVEAVLYYKNVYGFSNALFPGNNETFCYQMSNDGSGTILAEVTGGCDAVPSEAGFSSPGNSWVLLSSPSGLDYKRQIRIHNDGNNNLEIASKVIWLDTQGVREVTVPRVISNWRGN